MALLQPGFPRAPPAATEKTLSHRGQTPSQHRFKRIAFSCQCQARDAHFAFSANPLHGIQAYAQRNPRGAKRRVWRAKCIYSPTPASRLRVFSVDACLADVFQETRFDELKRYVRFSPDDSAVLVQFFPHAVPHFERIAQEFYERVREHEGAHNVFRDDAQVERLKTSLVRWMHRLLGGVYDEAYFQETCAIGRAHVQVRLPQHYMFAAMAVIRESFHALAQHVPALPAQRIQSALGRLLDMELSIMLEAYREDHEAQMMHMLQREKERAGQTLAKTEHRYVQAVELSHVLVIGLDAQTRIHMFNREAERVTEYNRLEVEGVQFCSLLLPNELATDVEPWLKAAVSGSVPSDSLDSAIRTKSGKFREIHWQLAYSPSSADDEVVLFAIGQDRTDQNDLSRKLRQNEKLAAVGTLAAGLAHEIRNPLNGAILHITFLERGLKRAGVGDPEVLEAVQVVADECKRLSTLVHEFLDFARPRPLNKKLVLAQELCSRAVHLVETDAAVAHVSVRLDLPLSDILLELDAHKIEQVLLNLLRNAIEACAGASGGSVVLRARRLPRALVLEVEDDGPGLSDPKAPIFDIFYSTKPQGTGLGLAIVHRIVTDHEGTIDVESRPGKTIFRITLPIRRAA